MLTLLRNGGPPAWIVLAFGLVMLTRAALFARRPHARGLPFQQAMSWAMLATMLAGFSAGLAASLEGLGRLPPALAPRWPMFLLAGIEECLAIVVLGASFMGLSWLVTAIGLRRLEQDPSAEPLAG